MAYPGHCGFIFVQREHVAERTYSIWPKTCIYFYWELRGFHITTQLYDCECLCTHETVFYVDSMYFNNTRSCVTDKVDFIYNTCPLKQDTRVPNLNQCYNLVRRHCPEMFLSIHVAEWLCVFRLFASAIFHLSEFYFKTMCAAEAENLQLYWHVCWHSQAISVICAPVMLVLNCWHQYIFSQQFRLCASEAVFSQFNCIWKAAVTKTRNKKGLLMYKRAKQSKQIMIS